MGENSSKKKCPYCAEYIKSEAIKCRYCGADIAGDNTQNNENKPPSIASCSKCNMQLVTKEKKKAISIAGIISVIIFFVGIGMALSNIMLGAVVMILALIIGSVGRGKKTIMVCPQCGTEGRSI